MVLKPRMDDFDTSDEEDGLVDQKELDIAWVPLPGQPKEAKLLALSALPGCRFRSIRRSLKCDIDTVVAAGIKEVIVLCTNQELERYKVSTLIYEYACAELVIRHDPIEDGGVPSFGLLAEICSHILNCGKPILIHCFGGVGRSCLVAALFLMLLNERLTPADAIEMVKNLRGPRAIQSVKQYNMIHEFRSMMSKEDVFSEWHK
eukprot:m.22327 g.22327  ORF g.22327 m.22327 type:complete len:204 (+) comp28326_c0_seq8:75-686(+)